MSGKGLGIAEAIENLRSELEKAAKLGEEKPLKFSVGEIELELALVADSSIKGEGGMSVLVVDANVEGSRSTSIAHRVKLTLRPGIGGENGNPSSHRGGRLDVQVCGEE